MSGDDRIERARLLYERAVFGGDAGALAVAERELDAVEADLALARGRVLHAQFLDGRNEDPRELALFERAAQLYQVLGDVRGESEALFWIGVFHQVVRLDNDAAIPVLERSRELAAQVDDKLTLSYALRHLGIAEHSAGRLDTAREWLEESVRLRRDRVPAWRCREPRRADLHRGSPGPPRRRNGAVEEAGAIAEASGAQTIVRQVQEARARL